MNAETREVSRKLVEMGLLGQTWTIIVKGIDGEDALLAKWREVFPNVDMGIERLYHGETRCWPVA